MKKQFLQRRLFPILFAVLLISGVLGCTDTNNSGTEEPSKPVEVTEQTIGNYRLTTEWVKDETAKDDLFIVTAKSETEAWNRVSDLSETSWSISAEYLFEETFGIYSYGRMLFGDQYENISMAVTIKMDKKNGKLLLTADQFVPKGWRSILGSTWTECDPEKAVKLKVNYAPGTPKAEITVTQGKKDLLKVSTDKISEYAYEMFERFGLGAYNGKMVISDITPRVMKKVVEDEKTELETISATENEPSDEWLVQENSVYNTVGGKPVVIIDGYGENSVWNTKHVLGDSWCFETKATFGSTFQGACCSRYMFGSSVGGGTKFLITVEYSGNRQVEAFMELNEGSWKRIGGTDDWVSCLNNTITVKLYKMAGVNRVCLDLIDRGTVLATMASDEIPEDTMRQLTRHGLMVYSSQVKFSEFAFKNSDEGCTLPHIVEKVYPKLTDFKIGDPIPCAEWDVNSEAVYYNDPELGEAMVIDSRGDTYCYYNGKLEGTWRYSARIDYGTYYGNVASTRVALADDSHDMTGLVTFHFSKMSGQIRCQVESRTAGTWTTEYLHDWSAGELSVSVVIERTGNNTLHVVMTGNETGKVYVDSEIEMGGDSLNRTMALGIGTLGTVTRWTNISMEP